MLTFDGSRWFISFYPPQWNFSIIKCFVDLQDNKEYTDPVYKNNTASILPLQGKDNEIGTYECRWINSRGESRHRQFTVSVTFAQENKTAIIVTAVSVTMVAIVAIGFGIGIKIYLDKVSDKKRNLQKLHSTPK